MTQAGSLVVPALLLSIAAGIAMLGTLPDWLAATVEAAPFVVFGGGVAVGILIRRGRLVLGLVTLALTHVTLLHFADRAIFDAIALLLPLNLATLAWLREGNLVTPNGALRLGVILAQAGVVATFKHPELAAVARSLERPLVAVDLGALTALPHVILVTFAASLGLVGMRLLTNGRAFAAGVAWALVASFLALDGAGAGRPVSVHFVTAGLLLIAGVILEPSRVVYRDDTTGLPGRLALNEAMRPLRGRFLLSPRYALAAVEIDEFRKFREDHGSDAARRMLKVVAKALVKVGGGGRVFYCEGHVFAVVFRRTSAQAAVRHLDAVRRAIEIATVDVRVPERSGQGARPGRNGGRPGRRGTVEWTVAVTISAGVAQPTERGADPHEVLRAAGRALDQGKQAGLNRVSVA